MVVRNVQIVEHIQTLQSAIIKGEKHSSKLKSYNLGDSMRKYRPPTSLIGTTHFWMYLQGRAPWAARSSKLGVEKNDQRMVNFTSL